jgi:hypothetical protein
VPQRSEFAAELQRNNGNIANLTELMRDKLVELREKSRSPDGRCQTTDARGRKISRTASLNPRHALELPARVGFAAINGHRSWKMVLPGCAGQ